MEELFWKGVAPDFGAKMLAGIKFFAPRYSKDGGGYLPRAHLSVRGWTRLSPPKMRLPFPLIALAA
eukprot:10892377-Karenia_brevis.AAC.1